ncbi:RluA family pseudouridine synthase [Allochromatium palmeri]|uniref:Pseudouridine synthase n=1 Tax=Allochromatium palmeri TaxID=231048 RepID=A0A6N8EF59_9GAMM|nr:RluA family pseudouridine synthase [Allochromatium palmeri]MTW20974.1 RluA family pseudouridine synthase [Allochromatium palmeri]
MKSSASVKKSNASGRSTRDPQQPRANVQSGEASKAPQYLQIDEQTDGQRIDNFLLRVLKGVPRSHLYRLLRRGEVRVNKGRIKAEYRLRTGDLVRIPPIRLGESAPPGRAPEAQLARLERAVIYEDERLLVIDKPSGLAVHGGSGLSYGLIESLRQLRPGRELELVHRLDRDTSGCLVICKRRSALRELHALIREGGGMDKRYLALILGELPRPELLVDAPLKKNVLSSGERLVRVDAHEGKAARTRFRRLQRFTIDGQPLTLVEAELITGRTHQIRVHAAHLGAPLAGDDKYGDEAANRRLKGYGLTRLFLHAAALSFKLDYMARPLRLESPLPNELQQVLNALEN